VNIKTIDIGGVNFIRLVKNDRKIERLLCSSSRKELGASRPLTKSTIFETIINMRNDAFKERIKTRRKTMRYDVTTVKRQMLELDELVTVNLPSFGDIHGIMTQVVFEPPSVKTVAVELNDEVLTYLSAVVCYQRDNEDMEQQQRQLPGDLPAGVTAVYVNGEIKKYRAQYKYDKDGKKKVKNAYFKLADAIDDVVENAREFTVNGLRTDVNGDQVDEGADDNGDDGDEAGRHDA
jgi:hypothetical protein